MKRACIKLNTNTDEQNAGSTCLPTGRIRPVKINFVRMKTRIISMICLLLFIAGCEEQTYYDDPRWFNDAMHGNIVGKVKQISSEAKIAVSQIDEIASTEINQEDGSFEILNLPIGNYDLSITADDYRIYKLSNVMVQGAGNTYIGEIDLSKVPDLISSHYPDDKDEIVYNNSYSRLSISITFTQPMDRESVEKAFSTTPPTEGIFHWGQYSTQPTRIYYSTLSDWGYDPGATITTYSKITSFTYQVAQKDSYVDTTYTVNLSTEARDTSGNYLRFPLEFTFSTIQSSSTQNGILSSPSHGDINVGLIQSSGIQITFPRNMDAASTEAAIKLEPETDVIYLWPAHNQLTIYTGGVLLAETTYDITVDSTAKDADGMKLGVPFHFSFETAAVAITSSYPRNGEVFVSESEEIRINFNTYMQKSTVQNAFSIDPPVSGSLNWYSSSKTTMEFDPSGVLQNNTKYTVTIGTGAKDLNGTSLKEPYVFSFVTRPE